MYHIHQVYLREHDTYDISDRYLWSFPQKSIPRQLLVHRIVRPERQVYPDNHVPFGAVALNLVPPAQIGGTAFLLNQDLQPRYALQCNKQACSDLFVIIMSLLLYIEQTGNAYNGLSPKY